MTTKRSEEELPPPNGYVFLSGEFGDIPEDAHASNYSFSNQDKIAGDTMAWFAGDLYIDSMKESPVEQWQKVARALRVHGVKISFTQNSQSCGATERERGASPPVNG